MKVIEAERRELCWRCLSIKILKLLGTTLFSIQTPMSVISVTVSVYFWYVRYIIIGTLVRLYYRQQFWYVCYIIISNAFCKYQKITFLIFSYLHSYLVNKLVNYSRCIFPWTRSKIEGHLIIEVVLHFVQFGVNLTYLEKCKVIPEIWVVL